MEACTWSDTFVVRAGAEQLSSKLGGEAVILDMNSGTYFGLNDVAARVWELVQQGMTMGAIRDQILAEFDVEPQQCQADLAELFGSMQQAGLVQIVQQSHT